MNPGGVPIARVLGIEVRVSLAWILLLAVVTVMGVELATLDAPELNPVIQWLIGAGIALMFLVSVAAHELGHALVGRRRGVPAGTVVLGFLGGLAPLSIRAARPRDELLIAIAGPLLSGVAALVLTALGLLVVTVAPEVGVVADALIVVGLLNLAMATLSLVPAMPVDGGRVVRAIVWARTGDPDRASLVSARVGRLVGWAIVGIGVAAVLANLVLEGLVGLGFGWMLTSSGRTVERQVAMERLLQGTHVEDAMRRDTGSISPHLTVDTFADRFRGPDALAALPVVDGDIVVGVIGRRRVARLGRGRLGEARVGEVMAAPPEVPVLAPGDALWGAIELLGSSGQDGLAVADRGRLAGLLTRDGVADLVRLRAARQAGATGTGR